MTVARGEIVFDSVEGVYHCVNRCVRRAFLTGTDAYTGQSFEHRKSWVRDRLVELSEIFTIEVCGFAVMSNHLHLVLRNRPDQRDTLTDREVAERWRRLYPKPASRAEAAGTPAAMVARLLSVPARLAVLRERLGSLSWFMKSLSEPIARRANAEDGCTGRFWEGRFKCQALLDEAAVLACMIYVDLNPVRASVAATPEESEFTSAHDHIEARQAHHHRLERERNVRAGHKKPTPVQRKKLAEEKVREHADAWLCPVGDTPRSWQRGIHGLLSLSLDEYLELLDWTGRAIRLDKRGAIPQGLAPILQRLRIDHGHWVETVRSFGRNFHRAAGHLAEMMRAAERAGRHWLQGLTACRAYFPEATG